MGRTRNVRKHALEPPLARPTLGRATATVAAATANAAATVGPAFFASAIPHAVFGACEGATASCRAVKRGDALRSLERQHG